MVCFVEKWAELGEPTPKARLAQARAFLALKMMDRAWIRLQELTDAGHGGSEALALTGRVFLERGWPSRARRPLELALLETPEARKEELRQLLARADAPPSAPPVDPGDGEDDPAVLLAAAEHQIGSGAFLKAEVLLERVRRLQPKHPRAEDLLWAMKGDYGVGKATLAELADRLGPDLSRLADVTEEPEHTESLDRDTSVDDADGADAADGAGPGAFPSLFRRPEGEAPAPAIVAEPEEVTLTSPMASLRALFVAPQEEEGTGDTQIVRVIHNDRGHELSAASGPMHEPSPAPSSTFDLAAYRREMGMSDLPAGGDSDFEGGLEQEDDSRIVLTHREPSAAEPRDPPTNAALETLEPDTTSELRRGMAALVRLHEAPTVIDAAELEDRPRAPDKKKPRKRRPDDAAPWWLLLVGLLLLFGATVLLLALLAQIAQSGP